MFVTTDADAMCFSHCISCCNGFYYGMMCYPFSLFLLLMYVRCP